MTGMETARDDTNLAVNRVHLAPRMLTQTFPHGTFMVDVRHLPRDPLDLPPVTRIG